MLTTSSSPHQGPIIASVLAMINENIKNIYCVFSVELFNNTLSKCLPISRPVQPGSVGASVTIIKLPNVYKRCPKMILLEKL